MTLLVFSFIILMGNVLRDVLSLITAGHASVLLLLKAFGLLVPWVLAFALPVGMLSATLLVFGRFSADNELTAIRASGISLMRAVWPVLVLSGFLSGVCLLFNCEIAPKARWAFKELQMDTLRTHARDLLTGGKYLEFGSLTLYARDIRGNDLKDVLLYQVQDGRRTLDLWAPEGEIGFDTNGLPSDILLKNAQGLTLFGTNYVPFSLARWPTNLSMLHLSSMQAPRIKDMTMTQLRQEYKKHQGVGAEITPVRVEIHRQLAVSMSCIGFALVGIPLGIRAHRRETNIGFALAIVLLFTYYGLLIIAQSLQGKPHLHPHWLLWIPNLVFLMTGSLLMWRANRGI
jgi:lipopolysaccharide export system permease protein